MRTTILDQPGPHGLTLAPAEPLGSGLARVCDLLFARAIRHLERLAPDNEDSIHKARIALKRLRALLRLARPTIGDPAFRRENRALQEIAHRLAPLRDPVIGLRVIQRLRKKAQGRKHRDFSAIETHLIRAASSAARPSTVGPAILRALAGSRRRISQLPLHAVRWPACAPALEKTLRTCRRRERRAEDHGHDRDFHRWRIRLKQLHYQLEFLLPVWPKLLRPTTALLDKLQKRIGDDHDLIVLQGMLEKLSGRIGRAALIRRVVRDLKKRSQKLRHKFHAPAKMLHKPKPHAFLNRLDHHWSKWQSAARIAARPDASKPS
jgi:CHAD domain-containing protein